METIQAINSVTYYAQFEDVDHISHYINGTMLLVDDPLWQRSGAESPEAYAYWANRACGMVCVKTCIEAFEGPKLPLHTWIQRGLAVDAYLTEKRKNNTLVEKGWLHAGLASVMEAEGLYTCVAAASLDRVVKELREGNLVIASVSYEIGTDHPITHQGGHLVVITGMVVDEDEIQAVLIHNPSGRTLNLRENAKIPVERFQQAFSGRVIIVGKP